MRKFTILLFATLLSAVGYSQGHETFDNLEITGTSYQDGSFTGQDGSEWNFLQSRGDSEITGKALMLGRNRTPDAELESGTISGGIGTLKFSYMQAFSNDVNLEVYVNGDLVYTATTDNELEVIKTTDDIEVNVEGDFTLKFFNPEGAQVTIDDIIWTAHEGGGPYDPCDDKTIMECGVEYTAELIPNAGAWEMYTGVMWPYTGSEKVWEFTAPTTGVYTFEVNEGDADADFFLMDACSNEANNLITNGIGYWAGSGAENYMELTEGETYYLIADLFANEATTVTVKVTCDIDRPQEPDFDCFQGDGLTLVYPNAYGIDGNSNFRIADDFFVEEGIIFTMKQITIDVNQQEVPDNAVINIREDNNGEPGEVIETITMAPTSALEYDTAFGDPIYHLTFDLDEPIVLSAGTYWLDPLMTTPSGETVWWLATSTGSHGSFPYQSNDYGQTWTIDPESNQMVFFVAGDCDEDLGVADFNATDFTFYPNPVSNVLNISSEKGVESASVFNLLGQSVMNSKVANGQIDVSSLATGTYLFKVTFEDGSVGNFKIIKK